MKCPIDTAVDLIMTDRQGIEIDYCPTCRGVWLDRGELDKIIERASPPVSAPAAAPSAAFAPPAPAAAPRPFRRDDDDDDDDDRRYRYERQDPRKKRKSMLGELFDF